MVIILFLLIMERKNIYVVFFYCSLSKNLQTIGSIQSYLIADTRGNLRDGFVRIHNSKSVCIEYEVTFELFNTKKNAKEVVDISRRLYNEGIVYPYFIVFSRTLKLWVVCYERFTQYNFHGIPLYEDVQNLYLSTRWKEIIRSLSIQLRPLTQNILFNTQHVIFINILSFKNYTGIF
uniref:Uncharacterized protein n=1 Tax=Opuntia streptacantha TaxID=393608 RepID=A0A7C9ED13_OPUST